MLGSMHNHASLLLWPGVAGKVNMLLFGGHFHAVILQNLDPLLTIQ